jgi:hypothetical protein
MRICPSSTSTSPSPPNFDGGGQAGVDEFDESDVDVLPPARLVAVDGQQILARLEGRLGFVVQPQRVVGDAVALLLRDQMAVEIDLGLVIVMQPQRERSAGDGRQFELAAQPDVVGEPGGANLGLRRSFFAESPGPALPGRVVEGAGVPRVSRGFGGVSPGLRRLLTGGDENFLLGKLTAGRTECPNRVELDQCPIVGEQAVGLGFDVGQLGVDGGG